MNLHKIIDCGQWPSAVWQVEGLPCVIILKTSTASGWSVGLFGETREQTEQSRQVAARLDKQSFHTRRDALQAVEVALWQN